MSRLEVIALAGLGEITPGEPLGTLLARAAAEAGGELSDDDVLVVSHKAVSKQEGRVRSLADVAPGPRAKKLADQVGKDPRLVELILAESRSVIRSDRVLIVETHSGWICANAGIDSSNVPERDSVVLLPEDADASARRLRDEVRSAAGVAPAVVIADSFGRPWRVGQTDVAIGCAGLAPLEDWIGRSDAVGRVLEATIVAVADEVAAAADLVRAKDAGAPAALVRGLGRHVTAGDGPGAAPLRRAEAEDLFR